MQYQFTVITDIGEYQVSYDFKLRKEENIVDQNLELFDFKETKYKTVIYDEVLSYSFKNKEYKIRKTPMIDTRTDDVFVPVSKYNCLIGNCKETAIDLLIAKKMAIKGSKSFIFSKELLQTVQKEYESKKDDNEYIRHLKLLLRMIRYGNLELFIINTSNTGVISLNALPLAFRMEDDMKGAFGMMMLPLEQSSIILKDEAILAHKVIDSMNIVLNQIIPNLTISLKELGNETFKNGKEGIRIQLMSSKNNKDIPLKYESDGIKKIISVLQLLIVIYNQSSITVAIDDLDAGIFEYLLGEILRIISEKGKGQLIFTSHNLRPLETIDRGFIAFTTTNPLKRYTRMLNIKDNNNLRDLYYRDIVLGEQSEDFYDLTNNAEIALAFREAGDKSES